MRTRTGSVLLLTVLVTAFTLVPVAPAFATETAPPPTVTATVAAVPDDPPFGPTSPRTADPVEPDVAFSTLGMRLPAGLDEVQVRTRDLDGAWREWVTLERLDVGLDGLDAHHPEALDATVEMTDPVWVGPSDAFQLALTDAGDPALLAQVDAELVDTLGLNERPLAKAVRMLTPRPVTAPAEASAGRPAIVSRAGWGADERITTGRPAYHSPTFAVLHHTAGSNTYTRAQAAGVVRAIHHYHARTLGWGDIGYNILVDRYGTIYEGRAGGLDRGVIGAHARGYNTGSFGVSIMGNFDVAEVPAAAVEAVSRVTAWKYDLHGINADPSRRMTVNGTRIHPFTSHRDVGPTACPGRYLYARMGQLRSRIAALASGTPVSSTRFSDVPATHTHHDAIETIAVRRITHGCVPGRYCPNASVTRAQMASFLARTLELPAATAASPFRDVSGGAHAPAIAALAEAGITSGCGPRSYCPDAAVTRAQMATFIVRGFDVPPAGSRFRDVEAGSEHASAIGGLAEAGIVTGYGNGTYRPGQPISRAEMAALLSRTLDWHAARR